MRIPKWIRATAWSLGLAGSLLLAAIWIALVQCLGPAPFTAKFLNDAWWPKGMLAHSFCCVLIVAWMAVGLVRCARSR